jgi:N-acetylglucosaminyldiphosphoundecaprenol N-acetyl-beta-D-mannosaminyltransferase
MSTRVHPVPHDTVSILGIPVDRVTMDQAMDRIEGFIASGKPHFVVTADSSGLYGQIKDESFRAALERADLITPDSFGVVWAAKRLGKPVAGRVSGVELVDRLCARSAEKGYRIFILGAAPGVAEMAAERLRLRYPGCNIVGTRHGFFPAEDDRIVAEEVAMAKPDVLFVAMGIPRQEIFIVSTMDIIRAKVAIGVGGSFDVFSGKTKRAPVIVQRMNLEWLWRLVMNPRKFSKAATLPRFAWRVIRTPRS